MPRPSQIGCGIALARKMPELKISAPNRIAIADTKVTDVAMSSVITLLVAMPSVPAAISAEPIAQSRAGR